MLETLAQTIHIWLCKNVTKSGIRSMLVLYMYTDAYYIKRNASVTTATVYNHETHKTRYSIVASTNRNLGGCRLRGFTLHSGI